MARKPKAAASGPYLDREELSETETREAKISLLLSLIEVAYMICHKAGLPIGIVGGVYTLMLDSCWCPEKHTVSTDDDHRNFKRMQIHRDYVLCPVHGTKFPPRQLIDLAPQRRKSPQTRDWLLSQFNLIVGPTRFYAFRTPETAALGEDFEQTLIDVHPSPKQELDGVLIECLDIRRAREILDSKGDELPWREGLHGLLRDDLTLPPNWHGCPLTLKEQRTLESQQLESAQQQRRARMKLVEKMRRDADRLVLESQ